MKRVLIIANHRADRSPGQRYRFEQYLRYLELNGYQITFSNLLDKWDDKVFYSKGRYLAKVWVLAKAFARRMANAVTANQYDIIFVFREAFMTGTTLFERLYARAGVRIIFDFDDSIWLPAVSEANKNLAFLKNPNKTATLIGLSDIVFAGNAYLAAYARTYNSNVKIVPSTVDTSVHKPIDGLLSAKEQFKASVCIGWYGSSTTLLHFEYLLPVLRQLKAKYSNFIDIQVFGDAAYQEESLGITGKAWNKDTEVQDLSLFDIGIMPLPDDAWTRGKCGMKGLLYMSVGVATVMSPVGVNTEIIQDGENGMLASTADEWLDKLSLLIENPDLRKRLGAAGRKTVVEKYSVQAWQDTYLAYFNQLVEKSRP